MGSEKLTGGPYWPLVIRSQVWLLRVKNKKILNVYHFMLKRRVSSSHSGITVFLALLFDMSVILLWAQLHKVSTQLPSLLLLPHRKEHGRKWRHWLFAPEESEISGWVLVVFRQASVLSSWWLCASVQSSNMKCPKCKFYRFLCVALYGESFTMSVCENNYC